MRTRFLSILAAATALLAACQKAPEFEGPEKSNSVYFREGAAPVELSADHETRTELGKDNYIFWNQGDAISLIKEGDNALQLLDAATVRAMQEGEKKSIILVNPAYNGCFLGFNGTERVRTSEGLEDLIGGTDLSPDDAQTNLNVITGLAENLRNNTDYIFTLERVPDGWLIYHRASGYGLTAAAKAGWMGEVVCSLGTELAPVDIQDGSRNGGTENVVYGRPEQIWVKKTQGDFVGYLLSSGGKGTKSLGWNNNSTAWTNWFFYEIPEIGYLFKSKSSGTSTTFTNDTGFSGGSGPWYAIYPSSVSPAVYGDELVFQLPHTQLYKPGTFSDGANVSVGVLHGTSIAFHSVCGVLKLSLKGKQLVQSISIKDKAGMILWGNASVALSSIESEDCIAYVKGGSDVITLDCGDGVALKDDAATEFYFVVPAGAFASGFEVTITTPGGTIAKSTSKNNTIARADIKEMPGITLGGDVDIPVINVENHVVSTYMAYGAYNGFGSSSSYLDASDVVAVADAAGWSADIPAGFDISWDSRTAASITVMEDGEVWYTEDGITGGAYTITNLTPGRIYAYMVDENGVLKAEGKFKTTGQVRMVSITDAWNCRDLGGWTGLNGATVKYGKVFRTASLNGKYLGGDVAAWDSYEFHGQKEIDRLGIKAELDLRGDPYSGVAGQWGAEGTVHSASLLKTKLDNADFIRIMTDWGLIYPRQRSSLVQDVAWIISELKQGRPVAFHCRIGADRTGGVAYLVGALLGVQEGDLARDYELTSFTSFDKNKRYANRPNQSFFRDKLSYAKGETLQERCYYYLNQYFEDIHINADDLDWFICEMLGLASYNHPDFAVNYTNNSLGAIAEANTGSASYTRP